MASGNAATLAALLHELRQAIGDDAAYQRAEKVIASFAGQSLYIANKETRRGAPCAPDAAATPPGR